MAPRCGIHGEHYTQYCDNKSCRKLLCAECVEVHEHQKLLGRVGLSSIVKEEIKAIRRKLEIIGEDNNAAFDMSSIPADKLESPIADIRKEINALVIKNV
jgi:hypothetical protein